MIGLSDIIERMIKDQQICNIVVQDGPTITFNNCIIKEQDGVAIRFFLPTNNNNYIYLLSDIIQIRYV